MVFCSQGWRQLVDVDGTSKSDKRVRVDGGLTETTGDTVSLVTIDETDLGTPITKVKDKNGNERQLTVEEALEHEFGHVWEQQGFGKQRVGNKNEAIKWENKYRKSKGVNFIRHDPDHSSY